VWLPRAPVQELGQANWEQRVGISRSYEKMKLSHCVHSSGTLASGFCVIVGAVGGGYPHQWDKLVFCDCENKELKVHFFF